MTKRLFRSNIILNLCGKRNNHCWFTR